jgi:hypothetical protein
MMLDHLLICFLLLKPDPKCQSQFVFQIPTKYQGHCALQIFHTPKE